MKTVFGFDMETDIGSWTPWYHGFAEGTQAILDILKKQNITATFYFTADAAQKNPAEVKKVLEANHEIGCHTLYHETIGDPLFEIPSAVPILPEEVPNRIRRATEEVEKVAGIRPVSFRCPRLWGSTAVTNALEDLGYVSDATYPMYFYRKQLEPYHPSREDWTEKGDLKLVELPNFADLSMESKDEYGRDLDQWPLFRTESAQALMKHVDGYISFCEKRGVEPFICFYMHPWEFAKMPEGLLHYGEGAVLPDPFIIKNCGSYAKEQLDILIDMLRERGSEFLQARKVKVK
ncbi:MAG: polysaccharide deacetylase family protein [Victivallaceae bacterium]|jgi:peptidoglycan/xylan/chitin deacetylase (PgdA/CDA1 family)|nr:polysaccharide deacetylase family protein [Victivallaceae bacterium]MDD3704314.1 polysaccharide deacetylase family protein [Victivallaceae bacterium]MDD4318461.1 polysaccharide deacetylase family protein [Victivallaceae bacterium]NLK83849.1 polysaccharide deacetylase family protein [Lentisphaerota bacterium]